MSERGLDSYSDPNIYGDKLDKENTVIKEVTLKKLYFPLIFHREIYCDG